MNFQNEKIVETKNCHHCNIIFNITDTDLEFYDKVSPIFDGEKFSIPTPKLCPECRQQRRLIWRNERKLYKRKCDATGKNIVSIYSPDKSYKVYNQSFWWSDKWDALEYGEEFNFEKGFFEQFEKLIFNTPHFALINNYLSNINSDYGNFSGNNKDCYFIFDAGSLENCYYSNNIRKSNNSMDCLGLQLGEKCYECVDCNNCFNISFSQDCIECRDSIYLLNCSNCDECILSHDLKGKKYHILNKEFSKEDYFIYKNKILREGINKKDLQIFKTNIKNRIVKNYHGYSNESVNGEYIYYSKNIQNSFNVKNLQDSKYCSFINSSSDISRDCYDYDYFGYAERSYESLDIGQNASHLLFCVNTWEDVSNLTYCMDSKYSSNCFGCVGIKNKSYCIFNKQYTKEQYEKLVPKIIRHMKNTGEWGEFFPSSISPFGYNETVAQEYFPLKKNDAITRRFNWSNYEAPFPKVDKIILATDLPNNILEIPDDILNWAIECEITKKPFRIIPQELDFYRKHSLPIPKRHPDQRHLDRMKLRNPRTLYKRDCDKCNIEMDTTYPPDSEEIVYCETCYDREVY